MGRIIIYLIIALLAFGIGSVVVIVSYFKTDINMISVEEPLTRYEKLKDQTIREIESRNKGFDELLNFNNGDSVTVQGSFDEKFLCHDVTESQPNICTTVLIGGSNENKSLLIHLPVCSERDKSNCIVWQPNNLCSENEACSKKIRIYDSNSKPTDLVETIPLEGGGISYYSKSIKIRVTGKLSIIKDKYYLKNPVEKIELVNLE